MSVGVSASPRSPGDAPFGPWLAALARRAWWIFLRA